MALNKRRLGKSGLSVTEIGIGLWAIGGDEWGPVDDQNSLDTIEAALDAGINFFDTADVYGLGHSESLLGQAMEGRREQFIVASKIGWIGFDHDDFVSVYDSTEKLMAGVEENLARLNTEYIDLLQCHIHKPEPNTKYFIEGFQRLQQKGLIKAYGLSSSMFEFIKDFNSDGGMATLQIDYSILNRTAEEEIFPYCLEHDIGVIVRGPLAMGILTGKFDRNTQFPEGDFRQNWIENPDENKIFLNDLQKVDQLREVAGEQNLAQLAIQFVLAHPAVTTVIPGAKTVNQLRQNVAAGELPPLDKETLSQIDQIVPPGGGRKIWPA
ncbi:MAG: aldo/keto reductase [Anaerolineales bacterium]|jgi:aryl-alcohol dehydrogenase-like predicted oxidoreductase